MFAVEQRGDGLARFHKRVETMTSRARDRRRIFASVGHYMAFTEVPRVFRESGPGWPAVAREGKPLLDTGRLVRSISYIANHEDVRIGSALARAKTHQLGLTILAKPGHALAIPLSSAFSPSEMRTVRPRQFHDLFVLKAKSGKVFLARREGGELILCFILLKSVKIKARRFLFWGPRARAYVLFVAKAHFSERGLPSLPMRGGNFDRGN